MSNFIVHHAVAWSVGFFGRLWVATGWAAGLLPDRARPPVAPRVTARPRAA